jgi:hypothetical protein
VFEKGERRKWEYGNIIVEVDLIKVYNVPQWNITMKFYCIINVCQCKILKNYKKITSSMFQNQIKLKLIESDIKED